MSEDSFSASERAAMKQRAEELRAAKGVKGAAKKAKEFDACLEAISGLEGLDRLIAERFHVVVTEEAPNLDPKTWYGFPSYAREGKVVTFVQPASKFDTRYTSIGFNEDAHLDDGAMWATSFAVVDWNDEVEQTLRELVRKAA
ncbi:hypothetical protein BHE97_15915 [Aeromicrobium sp. PE09-221]|uniref:hypothetical protein n=1 Tax=Aeromicrobium sp. PE09-221 TaxID=1898043 RepID=UPI000B3E4E72|nr:hypothetical protein [Aeromicrobium sp. PE09-221]OUZ07861.1 hypothetical protein BHE97_15915 [Aeromicrobium sp. PE09-221]